MVEEDVVLVMMTEVEEEILVEEDVVLVGLIVAAEDENLPIIES